MVAVPQEELALAVVLRMAHGRYAPYFKAGSDGAGIYGGTGSIPARWSGRTFGMLYVMLSAIVFGLDCRMGQRNLSGLARAGI